MINGNSRSLLFLCLALLAGCSNGEMEKLKLENAELKKKNAELTGISPNKPNTAPKADAYEKVEFEDLLALPNRYMDKAVLVRLKGRAQIGGDAPKRHFFLNFVHKYATGVFVPEAFYGKLKNCNDKNIDMSLKADVVRDGFDQLALLVVSIEKLNCN